MSTSQINVSGAGLTGVTPASYSTGQRLLWQLIVVTVVNGIMEELEERLFHFTVGLFLNAVKPACREQAFDDYESSIFL